MNNLFFEALDILGIISFSISGAMVGIKKQADLFGVVFLAVMSALGGGIMRDVLLGSVIPRSFDNPIYLCVAIFAALALFAFARVFKEAYICRAELLDTINNIIDAVGLGLFSVVGVQIADQSGHTDNIIFCVFLGMTTGIGGGLMRDVIVNEIPFVLKKRVYAVASLLGGTTYYILLHHVGFTEAISATFGIVLVFSIRMLATRYKWNLPRALDYTEITK